MIAAGLVFCADRADACSFCIDEVAGNGDGSIDDEAEATTGTPLEITVIGGLECLVAFFRGRVDRLALIGAVEFGDKRSFVAGSKDFLRAGMVKVLS